MEKGEHVPCKECKNLTPQVYKDCIKPCTWLVSWLCHEARNEVINGLPKLWGGEGSAEQEASEDDGKR